MPSSGPNFSSHVIDGGGDTEWINPANAQAEDGVLATIVDVGAAYALTADTFGFSIPNDATITGIKIEIKIKTTLSNVVGAYSLIPIINGTDAVDITSLISTSLAWVSAGGDGQLWGGGWAVSDINIAGFGAYLNINGDGTAGTIQVDAFRLTIYYTQPGGGSLISLQSTVSSKIRASTQVRRRM